MKLIFGDVTLIIKEGSPLVWNGKLKKVIKALEKVVKQQSEAGAKQSPEAEAKV